MKKKTLSLLLATAIIGASLAGCGAKDTESASVAPAETTEEQSQEAAESPAKEPAAEETQSTSLRVLAANNGIAHLDSVVAYNDGFYAEEGLDIEMNYNPSNPDNIQSLLADQADLVSAGATAVLNYIDQGSDIVIIGGQMSLGETLYARPERAEEFSELNEETLAGKKIGVTTLYCQDLELPKYEF